jgi:PAS domain S-box-containing protein
MMETALQESDPLDLRDVVETIPAPVVCASPDGSIMFVNRAWQEYTGQTPQHLISSLWQTTIHPDDLSKLTDQWSMAVSAGRSFETETRLRRVDGQYHWFVVKKVLAVLRNGKSEPCLHALIAFEDIDEQKKAEEERERLRRELARLAHLDRVSRIGELTASLAHEIKQPIGAVVTNAEACLRLLDREQPDLLEAREAALEMVKDARRTADIIDRVRLLFQRGSSQLDVVDLNEVIREMAMMLQNEANLHSVSIRTDFAEGLPKVAADRVQLQQVLMNLMLNSIEAMSGTSGELGIESHLGEDGQLLISVIDTGVGLPTDAEQIFNPFYTTKAQGTGLGLAITRSIVEAHGGRIWASRNSGRGATFHFTLPGRSAIAA